MIALPDSRPGNLRRPVICLFAQSVLPKNPPPGKFFAPDISTATYHIDNPNGDDPTLNMCSIPVDGGRPNSADLQLQ
jgi:hypothetical protein